jgi:hypothetical protein
MKIYIMFFCILMTSASVMAQDSTKRASGLKEKNPANFWFNELKIRQSFNDDESIQNPATFSITFPKDKEASYLIDLGLGYTLPRKDPKGLRTGFLVAEYHRTNLTDAEINNFQAGYKHQWIFTEPKVSGLPQDNNQADAYSTFRLNSTLKYRRDEMEGSHGVAATFMFAYFQQGSGHKLWLSSTKFSSNGRFHYTLSPEAGVEMQNNFSAENTIYKGFITRPVGRMVFGFGQSRPDPQDPFSPTAIWVLNLDAAARYDLIGETFNDEKFHPYISLLSLL